MVTQDTITQGINTLQKQLNAKQNIPDRGFRRNVSVYELISYVNNITGCYLSENMEPIPVFIERARQYMTENNAEEQAQYHKLVSEYLLLMERYIAN